MKINIDVKQTNIEMTPALQEYLDKRLEKLERFIDSDSSAYMQVEIGTITSGQNSGDIFRAELNLELDGEHFRTEARTTDLYKSIDDAKDEMVRSVKSYKGKRRTLLRKGGNAIKSILKGFKK